MKVVAEYQREDPSHSLEYCRVCCCHHSRTVFKVDKCELSHIPFVEYLTPSGCSQDTLACLTWIGHVMCQACHPMEETACQRIPPLSFCIRRICSLFRSMKVRHTALRILPKLNCRQLMRMMSRARLMSGFRTTVILFSSGLSL